MGPHYKIEHNSFNFWARRLKFYEQVTKVQKYKKYISTKVLITQPFIELQTPDFAWKFIWTVEPNNKVQKYKKYKSTKIQKYKNTKVQSTKAQSTKIQKYKKMQKM